MNVETRSPGVNAGKPCPECAGPMVPRESAFGPFFGCASYPACKGTRKVTAPGPKPHRVKHRTGSQRAP